MTAVVGRDAEFSALRAFLSRWEDGAAALVLDGEAGMGKTTLWRAGLEEASGLGLRVLRALPAECETALSFSALGDLLDGALGEALAPLVSGQAKALSRALVLDDDAAAAPDPHAVGVALLNALRGLAGGGPVLIAIDDAQWLDEASAGTLAYASRRLQHEPVRMLLAKRRGTESRLIDELRRSFSDRFVELDIGPLDAPSLHRVVLEHLGVVLPRPLLAEVHEAAGGNPFYALEIVRMLQRSDVAIEAGQPIPLPESLHDLVRGRLLELPPAARDFLLAAAAHAHPTVEITEAASDVTRGDGLSPALEARVVEIDGQRIRFTHPLLAAGAYDLGDPIRRQAVHARLAELLDDPEARAWQLAASVDDADEAVAEALEEASAHARARGALRPAALLLDRASELTPPQGERQALTRAIDASYLHFEAGDSARAAARLEELIQALTPGKERARALGVLAKVRSYEDGVAAADLFLQVVTECGDDRETLARAHEGVAASLYIAACRFPEALEHARIAIRLAQERGDAAAEADAVISQLGAETWLGLPSAQSTADRALALQELAGGQRANDQPLVGLAERWLLVGQHRYAREAIEQLLRQAEELGDESSPPYLLFMLGWVECVTGEPELAAHHARGGREAAEQSRQPVFAAYNFALEALAASYAGRRDTLDQARDRALAAAPRNASVELFLASAQGHLELAAGAPDRAVDVLARARATLVREGIAEPELTRAAIDEVEALLELGRTDEAAAVLDWYEGNARRLERATALANCARCRGLLAAQAGDLESALAAFAEALDWHAKVEIPLDRGRTLLALGATQRRQKRRREARATLEDALGTFERIGAALWAERARAELKRISGRAATPGALTPAEERVAKLVAAGKTNKEVAAALFLSDRTVEGHLAHVFGKLGIRHRTEVAGALQTRGIAPSNTGDSPVSAENGAP